jgi:poly-gamma-glutamate capsule biosynthesis protein CapA/YwtB (metallophosphatase superfamily)
MFSVRLLLALVLAASAATGAETIEDFDDGTVALQSWPGEDADPDSWCLDSTNTYLGSPFALRLWGNTWKLERVRGRRLDPGTVWQVACYVDQPGEIQGFGICDSAHALCYSLCGSEEVNPDSWVFTYQGAFEQDTWNLHTLPVGLDWFDRFGYLPEITGLVYINDRDTDPTAVALFDLVQDVTADLPAAPACSVWYETGPLLDNPDGSFSVTARFHSLVIDPDSPEHLYRWTFGDGATSADSHPSHTYTVYDDHAYTVLLEAEDETGLVGRASCRVQVDPGPSTFPARLTFTGDWMLARRYELSGGIIDTLGPEGIFDSILPWLDADLLVVNLESPLADEGERHPTKPIVFRGRPTNIAGLVHAGVDVVSLANNHVIDYGLAGMRQTQRLLDSCGILRSGAGAGIYEAALPVFAQHAGLNVGFLAASDRTGQYDNYQPYLNAGWNKPGFAVQDTCRLFRQLDELEGLADLRVVELHAGTEYSPEPPTDEGDEFYSPRAVAPADDDLAIRRRLLDRGADAVICHHPHILQGFEVHRGRLIAHSLGNFCFDQEYPETYPSVLLRARADSLGFTGFTVVPVYIDDYIPRRARGEFGNHILDCLARRSRDLNTWLLVNRDSALGDIVLDTLARNRRTRNRSESLALSPDSNWQVSAPFRLPLPGALSRVLSVSGSGQRQVRLGRELLPYGTCEDEGSTLWLFDQDDETYDTVAVRGHRSIRQDRPEGTSSRVTNLEERLVCPSDTLEYSIAAWLRADNSGSADAVFRCYSSRSGGFLATRELGSGMTGTSGWRFFHRGFEPASGTEFFDVFLTSTGPDSGDGRAWFDDVSVIEWGDWQPVTGPVPADWPNDIYWVQVRTDAPADSAELSWEETWCDQQVGVAVPPSRPPARRRLSAAPTVCRATALLNCEIGLPGPVRLEVFDALGRRVRSLVSGPRPAGRLSVNWDLRDDSGSRVSAGAYFCRLRTSESEATARLVVCR